MKLPIFSLSILLLPLVVVANPHDWPVHGHDGKHSFVNRQGNQINKNTINQLVKVWEAGPGFFTVTPGDLVGITHDPIIKDDIVYYGDFGQGILAARNAKTGQLIWQQQYKQGFLTGTILAILVHNDKIYFALSNTGEVRAVSRFDGSPIFTTSDFNVPDPNLPPIQGGTTVFASPIIVDNKVIFGNSAENTRGSLVAIDAQTGAKVWQTFIAQPNEGSGAGIWTSPAIDEDRGLIFVGSANAGSEPVPANAASMLAIDYRTGAIVWSTLVHPNQIWNQSTRLESYATSLTSDISVAGSPNLFSIGCDDVVGAFDKKSQYTVFNRDTGAIVWKRDNLANGYVKGNHKTAYMSRSQLTGQERQLYEDGIIYIVAEGLTEPIPTEPFSQFLAGDPNFIQAKSFLIVYALNATNGSTIWQKQFNGVSGVSTGIVATKELLFFGNSFGDVYALDRTNGDLLRTFPRDPLLPLEVTQLQTQVSISKGRLFIPGAQGLSNIQVWGLPEEA
jgi:outer membrane protein assembly factor BamB